jgi:hypothetical protein
MWNGEARERSGFPEFRRQEDTFGDRPVLTVHFESEEAAANM